jgi:glycosyltransferase involved in cell wall biosynthesis
VIASRVGGLPEVIVHSETGLLVDGENSQQLGEAIAFLLAHPEQAAAMGQAGSRRAQQLFSWDRCVEGYDALYRRVAQCEFPMQR